VILFFLLLLAPALSAHFKKILISAAVFVIILPSHESTIICISGDVLLLFQCFNYCGEDISITDNVLLYPSSSSRRHGDDDGNDGMAMAISMTTKGSAIFLLALQLSSSSVAAAAGWKGGGGKCHA